MINLVTMLNHKKLTLGIIALSILSSCEKNDIELINALDSDSNSALKSTVELSYEIYQPTSDNAYAEMKSSLIEIFHSNNSAAPIDLNKTVFLLEAGLSTLFEDHNYVNFDEQIEEVTSIEFSKNANFTTTAEVKANFTKVFNMIENTLNNNPSYSIDAIDISFENEDSAKVFFTAHAFYVINGNNVASVKSNSSYYWGMVPNAPYSAFAGTNYQCPLTPGTNGAFVNVGRQVRSVAPMNHVSANMITAYYNNFYMSTNPQHVVNRRLNGDYLVGGNHALDTAHRGSSIPASTCIPISNNNSGKAGQNQYAQAVVDQLYPFINKHVYWNGLISFRIYNSGAPDLAIWNYDTHLGAVAVTNPQSALSRGHLLL